MSADNNPQIHLEDYTDSKKGVEDFSYSIQEGDILATVLFSKHGVTVGDGKPSKDPTKSVTLFLEYPNAPRPELVEYPTQLQQGEFKLAKFRGEHLIALSGENWKTQSIFDNKLFQFTNSCPGSELDLEIKTTDLPKIPDHLGLDQLHLFPDRLLVYSTPDLADHSSGLHIYPNWTGEVPISKSEEIRVSLSLSPIEDKDYRLTPKHAAVISIQIGKPTKNGLIPVQLSRRLTVSNPLETIVSGYDFSTWLMPKWDLTVPEVINNVPEKTALAAYRRWKKYNEMIAMIFNDTRLTMLPFTKSTEQTIFKSK